MAWGDPQKPAQRVDHSKSPIYARIVPNLVTGFKGFVPKPVDLGTKYRPAQLFPPVVAARSFPLAPAGGPPRLLPVRVRDRLAEERDCDARVERRSRRKHLPAREVLEERQALLRPRNGRAEAARRQARGRARCR